MKRKIVLCLIITRISFCLSRFCFLYIESPRNHDSYYIMYPGCLHTFVDRLRGCFRKEAAPFFSGNMSMLCKYISHMFIILF